MKFKTNNLEVTFNAMLNKHACWFEIPNNMVDKFNKLTDKACSIEVKEYKGNRSLSANGYLWILLDQLSKKINIPKGDMYIKMIRRYGVFDQVIIKDEALTELIRKWDNANTSVEHVESLCEITKTFRKGPQVWHEVTCHNGSSGYDSKQFSRLLEGVISECELIGIDTMTPDEIEKLMANYNGG